MDPKLQLMRKCRPNLSDCGVMPLDKEVHQYLISSYILWPVIIAFGRITTSPLFVAAVVTGFVVLGFLFYNLLVATCQMSHLPKKRLLIGQGIFWTTVVVLVVRAMFVMC